VLVLVVPGFPTAIVAPTGTVIVGVRTKKSVVFVLAVSARSLPVPTGSPCTRHPTIVVVF
jgi:hypothetical protein